MRLFHRGLSETEKRAALELVRHLQLMYAYQQLTMECYNDALVHAGAGTAGSEMSMRTAVGVSTPSAVIEFVIPAAKAKLEVIERMTQLHAEFGRPALAFLHRPYDDLKRLLAEMGERAIAHYDGWIDWVTRSEVQTVETAELDRAQARALDASINSLNSLIGQIGLRPDQWLDINCQAFNAVRETVGLGPLPGTEFRSRYFAGMAGQPTRFFQD